MANETCWYNQGWEIKGPEHLVALLLSDKEIALAVSVSTVEGSPPV